MALGRYSGTKTKSISGCFLFLPCLLIKSISFMKAGPAGDIYFDMAHFTFRHTERNFPSVCWVSWSHDVNYHSIYQVPNGLHVLFDFFPQIILKSFRYVEKLQKSYSEHSIYPSSSLICFLLLHLCTHIQTHALFPNKSLKSELQTLQHFISAHWSMYLWRNRKFSHVTAISLHWNTEILKIPNLLPC